MTNQSTLGSKVVNAVRRYWIGGVTLMLLALVLLVSVPAWAAPAAKPLGQTVPNPTATKGATSVPQATNTPKSDHHNNNNDDNDNNNDNNNNQPAATATPVPAQPAPAGDGPTGVVNVDRLNVRQGPGTNFAIVGKADRGQTFRILNRNAAGDWWHVCCTANNQEGWVSASLIQPNFDPAQTNDLVPLIDAEPTAVPAATVAVTAAATVEATVPATQVLTTTATVNLTTTATVTASNEISAAAVSTESDITDTAATTSPLALTMQQTPDLIWQGSPFSINFVMTNTGSVAVSNVELRDELPPELKFVTAIAGSEGTIVPQSNVAGKHVLDVQWSTLAAGAVVTATVNLQMSADVTDGLVIDNLAVAAGENVASNTAGVSLGLPPATLPDFQ